MKLCLRCNQYFEDNVEQCPTDAIRLESVGKDPLIGALINNRYLVDSVIGKGSSGIVYRATRLGRGEMVVAIKVLHSFIGAAGSALDRFLREAQAASRLRNPHIITIWESGVTEDGQPYFVMDYLEGMTLGRLIREKGQIEPKRVLSIMRQTCEALVEAHRLGITHRDLKPENIVLQVTGQEDDYVKLLDFGIADSPQHALLAYKLEKPRTVSGSPAYMSPEQCQGFELDGRSDIYSLAIVVFEMLTGTRPFRQTEDVNVMVLHVSEPPLTLSEARPDLNFPAAIEHVIGRALSKQPAQRQPTIQDFFLDLENAWQFFEKQSAVTRPGHMISAGANKLQEVATTVASPAQKTGGNSGTVDTEVARANPYAASQPAVLGPPPARMRNTHNNLKAFPPTEQLTSDSSSETHDKPTTTGTTTIQRLMRAVQDGKLFSKTKNKIAAIEKPEASPTNGENSEKPKPLEAQPAAEIKEDAEAKSDENDKTFYVKQRQRNTISRLEGWKKADKKRTTIVSTRAKAATMKGDTVFKPVNLWNILLTITTLLCLLACMYIIYISLGATLPRPISLDYLVRAGRYDSIRVILEAKEMTSRLSPAERDQLGSAYLNLARSYVNNHEIDQALLLLARIDPLSSSATQGRKLRDKLIKIAKERNQGAKL